MIMNKVNNKSAKAAPVMLIIGILFIAANLRAPLTSVGPLVSLIRDNLHISNTLAGTITSLPLFAFALFSPLIPRMARKFGTEVCFFWISHHSHTRNFITILCRQLQFVFGNSNHRIGTFSK